jgi:hypothetical protein
VTNLAKVRKGTLTIQLQAVTNLAKVSEETLTKFLGPDKIAATNLASSWIQLRVNFATHCFQ